MTKLNLTQLIENGDTRHFSDMELLFFLRQNEVNKYNLDIDSNLFLIDFSFATCKRTFLLNGIKAAWEDRKIKRFKRMARTRLLFFIAFNEKRKT